MVIIVLVSVQVVLNLIGTSQLEPSFAIIIVVQECKPGLVCDKKLWK